MKKHSLYLLAFLISFIVSLDLPSPALAEEEISVVDMQMVMEKSQAAIDVRDQIKTKRDEYQAKITKQEDQLRNEEEKLSEQKTTLSPEAFEEARKKFKDKVLKAQRDVQSMRTKLDNSLNKSMGEVQKVILGIIVDLSKERGFKVSIPVSQILFADNKLDITNEVIERLNKKLPHTEVKTDQ